MNDLSTNTDGPAPTGWAAKIAELTPATFMGRDCADLAEKYRQVRGISLGLPGRPPDDWRDRRPEQTGLSFSRAVEGNEDVAREQRHRRGNEL